MVDTPRLFLVTPPVHDVATFVPALETALGAADVACVLLRVATTDGRAAQTVASALVAVVQRAGAAALIEGEPRVATRLGADGVHVTGDSAALDEALATLKPERIVGIGALAGRDAAMRAGEAGVDYLMFGGPGSQDSHADVCAKVAWWAEIFNVPCVGYAARPDLAGDMAGAGAEFVALGEALWDHPETIAAVLASTYRAITRLPEAVR